MTPNPGFNEQLVIEYDEEHDILRICGVPYAGQLFRTMALAEPGHWFRIEARDKEHGQITIFSPDEAVRRMFDIVTKRTKR